VPWAQLLRRVLHVDALACPRCSTRDRTVPMTVLAFLTDPDVVGGILRHLGLPTTAPALVPAQAPAPPLVFLLPEGAGTAYARRDSGRVDGTGECPPRPPP
jgi:hypothetical protein